MILEALQIYERSGNTEKAGQAYDVIGNTFAELGDEEKAMQNYRLSADIFTRMKESARLSSAYANIGLLHRRKDPDRALFIMVCPSNWPGIPETGCSTSSDPSTRRICFSIESNTPRPVKFMIRSWRSASVTDFPRASPGCTAVMLLWPELLTINGHRDVGCRPPGGSRIPHENLAWHAGFGKKNWWWRKNGAT